MVKFIIMNEQFAMLYVCKPETTRVWPLNTFSFIKIDTNLDEDKYSLVLKYISGQFLSISHLYALKSNIPIFYALLYTTNLLKPVCIQSISSIKKTL